MTKTVFVDENDNVIGAGTRFEAFEKGIIRRIIQIFLFNSKGELLIHKRSNNVLWPGKWDESAGGHVDEGESYLEAAQRELEEELGVREVSLEEVTKYYSEFIIPEGMNKRFSMIYQADYDGDINFNEEEVSGIRWITIKDLERRMKERPDDFMPGFIRALEEYQQKQDGNN